MDKSPMKGSQRWSRRGFALLVLTALVTGYAGLYEYVTPRQPARVGFWLDLLYYDLQLFVIDSAPLAEGGPFPVTLEIARVLAPTATVFALVVAASALFGDSLRRWWRRRRNGHAIVVGATPEARAVAAAKRTRGVKVVEVESGDLEALRSAGIKGASALYACAGDRSDVGANVAIALAAASLRGGSGLRINVHVTDPTLALGLKARRLMMDDGDGPVVEFFTMDEMAARAYVESDPIDDSSTPNILIVGAGAFGRAILVEFARAWQLSSPRGPKRVAVTLVDPHADQAVEEVMQRWPIVAQVCDVTPQTHLDGVLRQGAIGPYRAYFCYEDEHRALSSALTAVTLWRGGPRSVVVRLNHLARHSDAFQGDQLLLDNLDGRLHVANVADLASERVVLDVDPIRDLAASVHVRYIAERLANNVAMGSTEAMRSWADLPEGLRESNRAQARDFTRKLRKIGCTVAPRSALVPTFELHDGEVDELAVHEHDRWMAERWSMGWRYGPTRDDRRRRNPDMVPWADLPETSRQKDRDAVRNLPTIYEAALAEVGLQIVRLRSSGVHQTQIGSTQPASV